MVCKRLEFTEWEILRLNANVLLITRTDYFTAFFCDDMKSIVTN